MGLAELKKHVKTEHLLYFPFRCLDCGTRLATAADVKLTPRIVATALRPASAKTSTSCRRTDTPLSWAPLSSASRYLPALPTPTQAGAARRRLPSDPPTPQPSPSPAPPAVRLSIPDEEEAEEEAVGSKDVKTSQKTKKRDKTERCQKCRVSVLVPSEGIERHILTKHLKSAAGRHPEEDETDFEVPMYFRFLAPPSGSFSWHVELEKYFVSRTT